MRSGHWEFTSKRSNSESSILPDDFKASTSSAKDMATSWSGTQLVSSQQCSHAHGTVGLDVSHKKQNSCGLTATIQP
jgi:hypothetical protein